MTYPPQQPAPHQPDAPHGTEPGEPQSSVPSSPYPPPPGATPQAPYAFDHVAPQLPKRSRTRLIIGAAVSGALLLVAATVAVTLAITSGSGVTASKTIRINGILTLNGLGSAAMSGSGDCVGAGGYEDIRGGAQVTVTDEAGTVVGVGELGNGSNTGGSCAFMFAVASVPAGKSFYGVTVSHRGAIRYTEAQLKDVVQLTLGS